MKKNIHNMRNEKSRYESGEAMLLTVIFLTFISMTIIFGIVNPIIKQVYISKDAISSKASYFLAEGSMEDVIYRLRTSRNLADNETLNAAAGTVSVAVSTIVGGKQIIASANVNNKVRKMRADVILGTGADFHYGVQSGQGGFILQNSSSITGNVFSGGTVVGGGNMVYGDVISAGATGLINGIHATGTAYAHTIQSSTIDRDAYYVVKTSSTVNGVSHPGSTDQAVVPLPIPDAQITDWESDATAGGTMTSAECDSYSSSSNTCTISTTRTMGPKKIPFNLLIKSSSAVITVAGPLWVLGNITTQTGPTIKMLASLGSQNVAVIADNPSNTRGSGIITVGQSTVFQGSGSVGSFVFLISQNNDSEMGGSTDAVSMNQGASALVAYASHGQITLSQSVSVKEVTAYKIILTQSANVTYDTGLPSTVFKSGPSGGYDITDLYEIP